MHYCAISHTSRPAECDFPPYISPYTWADRICCCGGKDGFVKHTCMLDGSCALLCSAGPGSAGVVLNMHKVACEQLSAHLLRCSSASLSPSLPQPHQYHSTANSSWLLPRACVYMRLVCCVCQNTSE